MGNQPYLRKVSITCTLYKYIAYAAQGQYSTRRSMLCSAEYCSLYGGKRTILFTGSSITLFNRGS